MSNPTIEEEGSVGTDVFALGIRTGLPEELLYLVEKHPRATWEGQPGLAGTGDIWLANHDYFRITTMRIAEGLTKLREEAETTYDSSPSFRRHAVSLLGSLDGHHRVEDNHYFPIFQKAEPRLLRGFEIMDADHHKIHTAIDEFAVTAQDFLNRIGHEERSMISDARSAADEMADVVDRLGRILRQHLADEEDLVIPLIIERAHADPEFK